MIDGYCSVNEISKPMGGRGYKAFLARMERRRDRASGVTPPPGTPFDFYAANRQILEGIKFLADNKINFLQNVSGKLQAEI
jgi:hypothetical protein